MNDTVVGIGAAVPVIHIAIDVQARFYNKLSEMRRLTFSACVVQASNRLRENGVLTVWVAYTDDDDDYEINWDFYSRKLTMPKGGIRPLSEAAHSELGLHSIYPDDLVYVKAATNAFHEPYLKEFLDSVGCETVVYSGMNTCCCVSWTAGESADAGIETYVFTDLLADSSRNFHEGHHGGDVHWHANELKRHLDVTQRAFVHAVEFSSVISVLEQGAPAKQALLEATRPSRLVLRIPSVRGLDCSQRGINP